jgi:hypothetical protein
MHCKGQANASLPIEDVKAKAIETQYQAADTAT